MSKKVTPARPRTAVQYVIAMRPIMCSLVVRSWDRERRSVLMLERR
ncbi:hypothetical protein Vi05172_g8252 [Venturia inaequalis]|nr:hypothetical protein Vi05172_g8252 [Venturia inaequalis]